MAEVELRRVRKVYAGNVEAVKGITLGIPDGALCVLVGPSGCGKSTLLRMVAGLETITEGEISIGGRVVNALEPAERDIAMVFQNYALYPHMSVYDNMAYGLRNRGTSRSAIDARVREAAGTLEIDHLLERRPRQLSGGQRQRVAMGRAIVRDPKAFLFDEPLSNLDAKLRGSMRVEIKKLQRRFATTSLYVTHDQLEAMTLADLLVVMNAGEIEQSGAPLDLYARPASMFVASFLGAPPMNFLPARLSEGGLVLAGGAAVASPGLAGDVVVGVRPEDLTITPDGSVPDAGLALAAEVEAVEAVGAETYVHGRVGDAPVIVRISGKGGPKVGDRLRLVAPRESLHFFDPAGGRRIAGSVGSEAG